MDDDIAIKVDHISKSFKLPHESSNSLKGTIVNFWRHKKGYSKQYALKNISFDIKKGEFFGIVGRNGSGKSTLLKIISDIYKPDSGSVTINGKLTPFIELGVGFNPELTGRENVYLNGALLGFSNKEMDAMYDEIVEFAELGKFMDQKLKNYSSGMQVRLAFSVAIRAESDILVLDEVLAVGDEAFQKKCIGVFERYKANKRTVILVTHDMGTVNRFCTRAIIIDNGRLMDSGSPEKVSSEYTEINDDSVAAEVTKKNSHKNSDISMKLLNKRPVFKSGEELDLSLNWSKIPEVKHVGVAIFKNTGEYVFGTSTILEKLDVSNTDRLLYKVKASLGNGNYYFKVGLFGETTRDVKLFIEEGPSFIIEDKNFVWDGIVELERTWEL